MNSLRPLLVVICLSLSPECFAGSGLPDGENLIQPLPLPEGGWIPTPSHQGKDDIVDWRKSDTTDRVRTAILHRQGGYSPARFREINYRGGRESCKSFDGQLLDETPSNGYARTIWIGNCTQANDAKITALWLFISGKDSSYFIFRQWKGVPEKAAMDLWVNYFKSVKVCDTRVSGNARCSDALEPVMQAPVREGSLANQKLIQDTMSGVVDKAATLGCKKIDSYKPYVLVMPQGEPGSRVWREQWIVNCSGSTYPIDIRFNESGMYAADYTVE